jgi:hypothetical protein
MSTGPSAKRSRGRGSSPASSVTWAGGNKEAAAALFRINLTGPDQEAPPSEGADVSSASHAETAKDTVHPEADGFSLTQELDQELDNDFGVAMAGVGSLQDEQQAAPCNHRVIKVMLFAKKPPVRKLPDNPGPPGDNVWELRGTSVNVGGVQWSQSRRDALLLVLGVIGQR